MKDKIIKVCLGVGMNQIFPEEIEILIPVEEGSELYQVINRYGKPIRFIKRGKDFIMKGGDYYRYLFNENGEGYYAIDPSGGPFVSVGMDMGDLHKKLKGVLIEKIERSEEEILLITSNKNEYTACNR